MKAHVYILTLASLLFPAFHVSRAQQDLNYIYRMAGGNADDLAKAQLTDAQGNSYIAGDFRTPRLGFDGVQLNNAGGSTKTSDIVLAKVNSHGHVGWVVGWGGNADDNVNALALDSAGDTLFVGGTFRSDIFRFNDIRSTTMVRTDFWMNEPPGANALLVALDTLTGQPIKFFQIGEGDEDVRITALAVDTARNRLLVGGHFNGMVLWPGSNGGKQIFLVNAASDGPMYEPFVLAYDLGTYQLLGGVQLGGAGHDYVNDMFVHPSTGAVYLAGNFASEDFGVANGGFPRLATPAGTSAGFVLSLTQKLDAVTWARTTGKDSTVTALVVDAGGDALYLAGIFTSQTLVGLVPPGTATGISLARFQASTGQPTWAAALPAPQDVAIDLDMGQLFVLGAFSGVVALGPMLTLQATTGRSDVYVARVDAITGIALGAQTYGKGSSSAARFVPGCITLDPRILAVVLSGSYTDGNLVISDATLPADPSSRQHMLDIFIARTPRPPQIIATPSPDTVTITRAADDDTKAPLAQYGMKISGKTGNVVVKAVAVDIQGNAYIVGDFTSSSVTIGTRTLDNAGQSGRDIFIAKVRQSGQVEWAYSWGGANDDTAVAIALDSNGTGFYVAGNFNSPSVMLDDQTSITRGDSIFDDDDGGDDDGMVDDDDDGFAWRWDDDRYSSSGGSSSLEPSNLSGFVAKVSSHGNVEWVQRIGGREGEDMVVALAATKNYICVTGAFLSRDLPLGDNRLAHSGGQGTDVFWATLDPNTGNVVSAASYTSDEQDAPTDIVTDKSANPDERYPAVLLSGLYAGKHLLVRNVPGGEILSALESSGPAAFLVMHSDLVADGIAWARSFGAGSTIIRVAMDVPGQATYAIGTFPTSASEDGIPTLVKLDLLDGHLIWNRVLPQPMQVATDIWGFVYVSG